MDNDRSMIQYITIEFPVDAPRSALPRNLGIPRAIPRGHSPTQALRDGWIFFLEFSDKLISTYRGSNRNLLDL